MDQGTLGRCAGAVTTLREAARGARAWTSAERHAVVAEIERLGAVLVGARADVLAAEQAADTWRKPGVPSLGARVGRDTGIGRGAGQARVRQAEAWGQVPVLARAAEAGVITTRHVEAVGRATRDADPAVVEVLTSPEGQAQLVELAAQLDAPAFAKEVARAAARLDPGAPDRGLERQRSNRSLLLSDAPDGTRITGLLDHQAGRRLRLAIEAVSSRPAQDDPRTKAQRDADALSDLADAVLSLPDTGSGAALRPHVSLVMSVETLAELRAAQAQRADQAQDAAAAQLADAAPGTGRPHDTTKARHTGEAPRTGRARRSAESPSAPGGATPSGESLGLAAEPPCATSPGPLVFTGAVDPVTDEDGNVVPLSEVARILCDCGVTRIALDGAGVPVDLGRERRLYDGSLRRAVLARDRQCAWEGCTIPARWCEVHHIRWWDRDHGPTSIDNGVALCRHHHHEVHRLDLEVVRRPADLPGAIGRTPPGVGRSKRETADRASTAGPDPGRPLVRYTIRTRDGTVVAGGGRRPPTRTPGPAEPPKPGDLDQDLLPIGA